jgi:CRP/FNR family transcriptional regulator
MDEYQLHKYFPSLGEKELRETLLNECSIQTFEKDTILLEEGNYVKVLPLVIEGSVKIFKKDYDKEILMYYIKSGESCIMSISACIKDEKSQVQAITSDSTKVILVPIRFVNDWMRLFPTWNTFIISSYQSRFDNLLTAFNAVVFEKMDTRLVQYLKEKANVLGSSTLKTTHIEIATELATARVVISRLLKDLENQGKIKQTRGYITINDL